MNRRQLLWQLSAEDFAALDTRLYLDTHPGDRSALKIYEGYTAACAAYKKEYESQYGPLCAQNDQFNQWSWVNEPWPWEKEAN